MASELARIDAVGQSALVRAGEATPAELVEAAITRCEAVNPELNAVIHPCFERARHRAQLFTGAPLGGVPMLTKDLVCKEAGLPFHEGSRFLQEMGWTATEDQVLVERFRAAGLVSIGRTNCSEFGMRPLCEPLAYGPTRNPWDLERSTGGSSGGSAAAVAAGIVPVAHANDVGGSIRIPASACGLVGLKPSRGRSTMAPDFFDAMGGLAEELVVARSVRDVATVLDLVTAPAPGDWHAPWPAPGSFAEEARRPPGALQVGVWARPDPPSTDEAVAAVVRGAAALLEGLGHHVDDAHPAALDEPIQPFLLPHYLAGTTWIVDHHWPRVTGRGPIPPELLEPSTAMLATLGRSVTGGQLLEARELAQAWTRRLAAWFDVYDLLVLPTLPVLPPRIGEWPPSQDGTLIALTAPFNLSGQPAISVPLGAHDGVPVGVQLVAAHGGEALLLQVAAQLEAARPWADRRPPLHA